MTTGRVRLGKPWLRKIQRLGEATGAIVIKPNRKNKSNTRYANEQTIGPTDGKVVFIMARKKAVRLAKSFAARVAAYPESMSGYERESLAAEAILAEKRKNAKIRLENKRKRR